jgi:hypothetical protein
MISTIINLILCLPESQQFVLVIDYNENMLCILSKVRLHIDKI